MTTAPTSTLNIVNIRALCNGDTGQTVRLVLTMWPEPASLAAGLGAQDELRLVRIESIRYWADRAGVQIQPTEAEWVGISF